MATGAEGRDLVEFVLLDGSRLEVVKARLEGDEVRIPAAQIERALGWTLEPEGLCREGACIPLRDPEAWIDDRGLELAGLARALGRPLALDPPERAAALGTGAPERAGQLASLEAPDFELPDLEDRRHRLSDQRGRKVLLIAYASW